MTPPGSMTIERLTTRSNKKLPGGGMPPPYVFYTVAVLPGMYKLMKTFSLRKLLSSLGNTY